MDCARVEFSQNNHSLKVNKIVSSTAHFFTYPSSMGGFAGEGGVPTVPPLGSQHSAARAPREGPLRMQ